MLAYVGPLLHGAQVEHVEVEKPLPEDVLGVVHGGQAVGLRRPRLVHGHDPAPTRPDPLQSRRHHQCQNHKEHPALQWCRYFLNPNNFF